MVRLWSQVQFQGDKKMFTDPNVEWAAWKNQFAQEEIARDQAAFEAKMDAEMRMAQTTPLPGAKVADAEKFVTAGHAIFTVLNTKTGNRFTFKVSKHEREENFYWVGVLTGPTNTADYTCVGRIVNNCYIHNKSSKISENAQSNKVFAWFWIHLHKLPDFVEVWHCGRCCCCGRLLTTPESVAAGIGPVCASR
jgi:hypothetical protein